MKCSVNSLILPSLFLLLSFLKLARAELGLMTVILEGMRDKCFVEELPEKTVILVKHQAVLIDVNTKQPMPHIPFQLMVTVRDPAGHTIIRQQHKPDHKLFMTSTLQGEYTICFQTMPTQYVPNVGAKFAMEIFIGDDHDPRITAPIEVKLHELSGGIAENNRLIAEIEIEQQLQREREDEFRKTSERMLSTTFWFAFLQTIILAGTVYLQSRHLQKFFQYKKIV